MPDAGKPIEWHTDDSETHAGWELCFPQAPLQVAQPPSHPSLLRTTPSCASFLTSASHSLVPQCESCDNLTCSAGFYRGGTGCTAIVYGMRVELGGKLEGAFTGINSQLS